LKIYSNGINPITKKLINDPLDEEEFGRAAYNSYMMNAPSIVNSSRILSFSSNYNYTYTTTNSSFDAQSFVVRSPDLNDPQEVGWTFLVNSKDPQVSDIIEIIKPLAKLRKMKDPESPLFFNSEQEIDWLNWLQDNYYALELKSKKVPHYVLLVGDPKLIPFKFQSLLDANAFVGRIDFNSRNEMVSYINRILEHEKNKDKVSRNSLLMGTDKGVGDPTHYSAKYLVKPIADYISSKLKFETKVLLAERATKKNLINELTKLNPALIFTATHGGGFADENILTQKKLNGGIYCHDPGDYSEDDILFTSYDVTDPYSLEGSIFFQFACFGYGTPAVSDFWHWTHGERRINSTEDFVSDLPKKLLSVKGGCLAYIGHVDEAWLHGFTDARNPEDVEGKWHNRIVPFVSCVNSLLTGEPVGRSINRLNTRYEEYSIYISNMVDQAVKNSVRLSPEFFKDMADTFVTMSDAKNYMVFGDPAVSINIPS
jgi:hypothetical protein